MKGGVHFGRDSRAGAGRHFDEAGEVHQEAATVHGDQTRPVIEIDTWASGERIERTTLAGRDDLVRWVEGIDLATGEPKGVIRSSDTYRPRLRFIGVEVNNPKSLSVVASQNPAVAAALERVLARQADGIAKYLSSVAVTRIGPKGTQREVGGLTVETARVTHATSREGDPHRHVHLMLNTRVMTPDRTWHGLYSMAIRQHIQAINARGSRILVTDLELRQVLAAEGYTLGADGEIDQARGAVEFLSKRTIQIAERRGQIEAAWREAHPGREPSQRARSGWDDQAKRETRKAKQQGTRETPAELTERVRMELAAAGFDFTPGGRQASADPEALTADQVDREATADEAVAVLSAQKSAWSEADLTAQVEAAVARSGVVGDPQAVTELVEDVRARAAAQCLSVLDAELHAPTSMSRHLTSAGATRASSDESGQIVVMAVVFMTFLLALFGLVADGGRYLDASSAAGTEASQAARAGANAIAPAGVASGNSTTAPQAAVAAAERFMASAGHPGTAWVVGGVVYAHVSYAISTRILSLIGVDTMHVHVTEQASDVGAVAG